MLSILECSDLQTVPRFYNWTCAIETRRFYLIRNLIGEAFPPYFTFLHGQLLASLLSANDSSLPNGKPVIAIKPYVLSEDRVSERVPLQA